MALIGNTPEFNIHKGDWTLYTEILEQFFEINSIEDHKKCAYLISVIGQDCYRILNEICYPEIPKKKSYEELCDLLSKHFDKKNSVFLIRNKFYRASQYPTESIAMWFFRVKKLSKGCRFGDHIESILIDRFITGLNQTLLERFYNEMDQVISLDKAFNMAMEWDRNGEPVSIRPDNRRRYQNNNRKKQEGELEIIDGKKSYEKKMNNFEVSGGKNKNNPFEDDNKDANCYSEYKVDNLAKSKNINASNYHASNKYSWKAGESGDSGLKNTNPFKPDGVEYPTKPKPQRVEKRSRSAPRHCQPNNPERYAGHNQRQYEDYQYEEHPVEYEYVPQNQRKRNNKPKPKKEEDSCVLC